MQLFKRVYRNDDMIPGIKTFLSSLNWYLKYSDDFSPLIFTDLCFKMEWFADTVKQMIEIVSKTHIIAQKAAYA